jgi:PAS domain S-box-containing protein
VAAASFFHEAGQVTFWAIWLAPFYLAYQHLRMKQLRRRLSRREELFRLISENAADMVAVVDVNGRRLYNSPAYKKVLGYSSKELGATSAYRQIHPEDVQMAFYSLMCHNLHHTKYGRECKERFSSSRQIAHANRGCCDSGGGHLGNACICDPKLAASPGWQNHRRRLSICLVPGER